MPILLEDVSKRYRGGSRGVTHVDLEVHEGEVFAFLGPNGAGKTTTIRLLLDLIRPDSGSVRLFGREVREHSVALRRRIGYLPGDLCLYEDLTARELLTHFAHLRGGLAWATIETLTAAFEVEVDRPIRTLSKGNRQKVGLVQAMMGDPALLILDEPTSGLDPLVQTHVHRLVRTAASEGRTVFLSSHVLSEVGRVADRVGIIREGAMVAVKRVVDLQHTAVHYVDVRFVGHAVPAELKGLAGAAALPSTNGGFRLAVRGSLDPLLAVLAAHPVEELTIREPELEEIFFSVLSGGTAARPEGTSPDGPPPEAERPAAGCTEVAHHGPA